MIGRDTRWDKGAPALRLVSVPASGTVFTRYVLGLMGLADWRNHHGTGYLSHHTYEFTKGLKLPDDVRIVTPLRDPMLVEATRLSRSFGTVVTDWDYVTRLDAHFFRVPPPDADHDGEIRRLAAFVGSDVPVVDWSPKNSRPDTRGLKAAYLAGDVPDALRPAWDWLRSATHVQALFRRNGYDLPWMR